MPRRIAILAFGLLAYGLGVASFIYLGAALVGLGVAGIDGPRTGALMSALWVDLALISVFALQHTLMARPGFKRALARALRPTIERSTYVLLSAVALTLLLYFWRPLGGTLWHLEDPTARGLTLALYFAGWGVVLASTFALDHFDLFGLRQVYLAFRNRAYTALPFSTPGPYRWVRHPIYVGWLTVFWVTPTLTWSHAVLAGLMTAYIFVAIRFEERDLIDHFGPTYEAYREQVPALIPRPASRRQPVSASETAAA